MSDATSSEPNDQGVAVLPDGSAFATASMPLPRDHWLYAEETDPEPVVRLAVGNSEEAVQLRQVLRDAAQYAIRGATMKGKEMDFDPDALVQNFIYALVGPREDTSTSSTSAE